MNLPVSYKIYDESSDLFCCGGMDPKWSKTGKSWSSIGALKSFLRQWERGIGYEGEREIPATWKIVTLSETNRQSAWGLLAPQTAFEKKQEREVLRSQERLAKLNPDNMHGAGDGFPGSDY